MKTKTTIITISVLLLSLFIPGKGMAIGKSEAKGIEFHQGDWDSALEKAKAEDKLIFLDMYATWCGPCKRLKANTFTDGEVGLFYNENYINVAFDAEKGEGKKLATKYGVTAYPSLFFIDKDGNVVTKAKGYHNPAEFLQLGKAVKEKL